MNKSNITHLQTDIETPDKVNFEFSTIIPKSIDKLSSQKNAASSSKVKPRDPSQIAQLKLSTNPPDSVKRFVIKKSFINALETVANDSVVIGIPRNKSVTGCHPRSYN